MSGDPRLTAFEHTTLTLGRALAFAGSRTRIVGRTAVAVAIVFGIVTALGACTSTRQLRNVADPRLRAGGHHEGFVVRTTTPWRERIDPSTAIRFGNAQG